MNLVRVLKQRDLSESRGQCINGRYEFEQVPGVGDGQGSLLRCSPGVAKSRTRLSDRTELNLRTLSLERRFCLVETVM